MKKYLNKNVFFQGDAKIGIILASLFIAVWVLLEFYIKNSYDTNYNYIIYDYSGYVYSNTPLGRIIIVVLSVFLVLSFISICGMFKRKKWSTLLSCTFSRIDIRKRELVLMGGCIIGFILIFLLVCIRYSIENAILVSYIDEFWTLVGIDVIRIIIVSLAITAILFFIDSLTSNMYVTLGTIFTIGLYCGAIVMTIGSCFLLDYSVSSSSITIFIMDIIKSIIIGSKENVYTYEFLSGVIAIIVMTSICGLITKKLTGKMKIEHMGDAFIFSQIRNIIPFLLSTLIGMGIGNIIFQNLLWNGNFKLSLNSVSYPVVSFGIIIIVSIIANIIIKSSIKAFKNKIPKKYI